VVGRARAWLTGRLRLLILAGALLAVVILVAVVLTRGGSPSIAGSPALPSTYRAGVGIGPVSLGDTRAAVLVALAAPGKPLVPGTLVFARPDGALAVGFVDGRVASILATGATNPFGQRLAAEETTLTSWNVELCAKPARVLLVAPGGRTYFVFPNAGAGLGAVGVSVSPVKACGSLG
jgi:hypothetical protein